MYTDDDYDYDWDEFFLKSLCMKLVLYFFGVIFLVFPNKVLAWDFYLFGPKEAAYL
jgi:hypothetical protein